MLPQGIEIYIKTKEIARLSFKRMRSEVHNNMTSHNIDYMNKDLWSTYAI